MNRRRGVTLIEVLAAIFIMGIGLMALLVLFPLGALSMARSVRDNNAASAGSAAFGIAQAFDLRNDPNVLAAFQTPPSGSISINGTPTTLSGAAPLANGPGYPVYVDPFYTLLGSSNLGFVGQNTAVPLLTPGMNRVAPLFNGASTKSMGNRFFTYWDDLNFGDNGLPLDPSLGTQNPSGIATVSVDRPARYTWAYLLRPARRGAGQFVNNANVQEEPLCEMSVVVYLNRQTNTVFGENSFSASGAQGSTSVTLTYGPGTVPDLRTNDWILDTSYDPVPVPPQAAVSGSVHGYFYKVVDFTDTGSTLLLTVQTPLRMPITQLVHMQNVLDVQERGLGPKP